MAEKNTSDEKLVTFPSLDPLQYVQDDERISKRDIYPNSISDEMLITPAQIDPFVIDLRVYKSFPSLILDASTTGDTDWWIGNNNDSGGSSNDMLQIGTGIVPGTSTLYKFDATGIQYFVATSPFLYLQPVDNTSNWSRISASVDGATYIKVDWQVRSQTYGAIWGLFGYRGNTGSNTTRDVLAVIPDGNIDVVMGSASRIFDGSGAGRVQFAANMYAGPTRSFNFVNSDRSTLYKALSYDGTFTVQIGPTTASSILNFFAGSTTSRIDIAATGDIVFNESGVSIDHRFEGDTDANLLFLDGSADTVQVGSATTADSAKFYVLGKISTSGEMEINGDLNHDGTNVGFYTVAPTARPSAYTQTYSTATRTHANLTAATLTDGGGGTANSATVAIAGTGDDANINNNFADIVAQINALLADITNVKQVLNQVIDDHQLNGLLQ